MGGSKLCGTTAIRRIETVGDFEDKGNWHHQENGEVLISSSNSMEIVIKKVDTARKNIAKVKVGSTETEMFTDSGVKVSVAPTSWYRKSMGKLQEERNMSLIGYGSKDSLPVKAKLRTRITTPKGAYKETWIYLVEIEGIEPLMGDLDATDLGFLVFNPEGRDPTEQEKNMTTVRKVAVKGKAEVGEGTMPEAQKEPEISEEERVECRRLIDSPKYATIFDGHIGKMVKRKPIVLHSKEEQRIINQPYRPSPPQFHEELSQHLQTLRRNGKIVDVDPNCEKIETCSNVVLTRKTDGSLRMNIDATPINKAAAEVMHPHMTTPEEVRHKLSGSTRFSEFDMNHGYNQSTLSEESSRKYAVFQTHEGFHRFTSLYFGHCQAAQAFDQDVKTSLRGLKAVESVADNILVHSKKADQHKQDLAAFLDRCLEEGITLKKQKTVTCQKDILWFGYVYGRDGVRPDPAKTQKLKEKGPPKDQEEVRSFLQAAQFNAKFMWNTEGAYANTTQPLRKLLQKDAPFVWGKEEDDSYNEIIAALESAGALYPYNPDLDLCHVADAQPHGIGSSVYMITRDEGSKALWWPLNHSSRSLTKTESSYPQIDRESLAQAWGMKQHHFYLIGRQFTTFCDHKPLLPFYNGTKKPTPRVEKHILSIQDLQFRMEFIRGKENPVDWSSRHPEDIDTWSEEERRKHGVDDGEEIRLNRVIAVGRLDSILEGVGLTGGDRCSEQEIVDVGAQDAEYSATLALVKEGKLKSITGEYKQVANELSSDGDFLLRDSRIVVPFGDSGELRQRILKAAHEGHPGVSRTKARLRSSVYWPSLTKDADQELKPCLACQSTTEGKHHKDLLHPSQPPDQPWSRVGCDHWGPTPDGSGRHILVLQDYLTKYPEAIIVKNTAAEANIRALEEVFGRHGYPNKLVTDNGPPWNGTDSHAMKEYLRWAGVTHDPTRSADDPEANGLAERLMQLVGKSWETATVEGTDPLSALNTALKTYRNTEHSVTGRKPAEWLFGRAIRTRLPDYRALQAQHDDKDTIEAKQKIIERGKKEKERRDKHAREESLEVGMKVLLKNKVKRKGQPKYDPKPYTITELHGRQATLERGTKKIKRETQKFKRFFEAPPSKKMTGTTVQRDDWEESWRKTGSKEGELDTNRQASHSTGQADTDRPLQPESPVTADNVPAANDDQGQQPTTGNQQQATVDRRTSNRERRARDMYGDWDTSQRREYNRR